MVTTLFWAKESMERPGDLVAGSHHPEYILSANHLMVSTTVPVPGTAQEFAETIHDTLVNGECHPSS